MIYNSKNKFKFIKLFITNQCNLRCPYCCFGNQQGNCIEKHTPETRLQYFKVFLKYLNDTFDYKFVIRLIGGEPLLFPLLDDLVKFIHTLPKVAYIELYSNLTLPVPESLCNNKTVIISSIHNYKDIDDEKIRSIIKNIPPDVTTQFNVLTYDARDIGKIKTVTPLIRDSGASVFPQLIQGRSSEKYVTKQRECMGELLEISHSDESYYCKYLLDNFNTKYIDFFNQYNRWYDDYEMVKVVQSSYTLESDLLLHQSNGGIQHGFIDEDLSMLTDIAFPLRGIRARDIFINELLFSNSYWV